MFFLTRPALGLVEQTGEKHALAVIHPELSSYKGPGNSANSRAAWLDIISTEGRCADDKETTVGLGNFEKEGAWYLQGESRADDCGTSWDCQ